MAELIDSVYLPFTEQQLREHFVHDLPGEAAGPGQVDPHTRPYLASVAEYDRFCQEHPGRQGLPLMTTRRPCQIEKDERFWIATAMLSLYHHGDARRNFAALFRRAYGEDPPVRGLPTWEACLEGDLWLYLEAKVPSPAAYREWLTAHLREQHFIPYVLGAAGVQGNKNLEGPTVVDAVLLNRSTGFAVLFEAKVLSDISCQVSFDSCRNQLARNVDVMLERSSAPEPLAARDPDRTLFCLLTPGLFRSRWQHRLYGWLFREYTTDPGALARDLSHRSDVEWGEVARRIGWVTWEDCDGVLGGLYPWMRTWVDR